MTYQRFFRWVAWLLLLGIAFSTLSPLRLRPLTDAPVSLERFAAFAALGVTFSLAYPAHRLRMLVLLIGVVMALELAQHYAPDRHGRLPDAMVKAAGTILGGAFAALLDRRRKIA